MFCMFERKLRFKSKFGKQLFYKRKILMRRRRIVEKRFLSIYSTLTLRLPSSRCRTFCDAIQSPNDNPIQRLEYTRVYRMLVLEAGKNQKAYCMAGYNLIK